MLAIPTNRVCRPGCRRYGHVLRLTRRSRPLGSFSNCLETEEFSPLEPVRLNTSFMRVELDSFSPSAL